MLSAEKLTWVISEGGTWDTSSTRDETLLFLSTLDMFCSRCTHQSKTQESRNEGNSLNNKFGKNFKLLEIVKSNFLCNQYSSHATLQKKT